MDKNKYWKAPRIWPSSTVYIIGGGISLAHSAKISPEEAEATVFGAVSSYLEPIHKKRVIGVNNAYQLGDWIDAIFFGDCHWWREHFERLRSFAGLKMHNCDTINVPSLKKFARGKAYGIDSNRRIAVWNNNSGGAAINIAVHFGAKRIVLLGFDMHRESKDKNNWHKQHSIKEVNPYPNFITAFRQIKKDADKLGVEILNATSGSSLDMFPIVEFEDVV